MGAEGMVTKGAILRSPGTKYKRSKNAFASTFVALTLVPLGTKLLEISAQVLIGSPGTLLTRAYTHTHIHTYVDQIVLTKRVSSTLFVVGRCVMGLLSVLRSTDNNEVNESIAIAPHILGKIKIIISIACSDQFLDMFWSFFEPMISKCDDLK